MQNNVLEGGIAIMAVRAPPAGTEIHLHVAGPWRSVADLHDRAAKVGSAFNTAETGMKDSDRFTVQGLELLAEQALVLPNGLQEAFRG
jgi:hypothetical protein